MTSFLPPGNKGLIITDVKNMGLKKQLFRINLAVKLAYGKISIREGKLSPYLIYDNISLSNHTWLEKQNLSIES